MKVHLIDGTYELFRAYFGAPPAKSPDGRDVGATRGLLRSLAALVKQDGVTHVGVAFDHVIESFRNRLFAGYKTGEGVPPELMAQFELAERACHALGIATWPMVEFEADDALATAAALLADHPEVEQVVIGSPDKDLAQCVRGNRVVMHDRVRDKVIDEAGVVEKWGVSPASIPDWLALVGDDADGIPGLPRWGAKSASCVLARWRHVEHIPDDEKAWEIPVRGAASLASVLREQRNEAMLYRTLATLRRDVPVACAPADLVWTGARKDELHAICEELGEKSLPSRIDYR